MKKNFLFLISLIVFIAACNQSGVTTNSQSDEFAVIDSIDATNNFYDNVETFSLPVNTIVVEGEISNPGNVDLASLPLRSVIVKEALPDDSGGNKFTGAFRYDGYSLLDILNARVLQKKNLEEFAPIIDLYVEVENSKGEKVVFSWGEIFYPNNLHRIIVATRVARIVPSKTNELWALPVEAKIVAGNDLLTSRNISDPVKITVRSYPKSFVTVQGLSPMFSNSFGVYGPGEKLISEITELQPSFTRQLYNTIFYGRGRGIHSTTPFNGVMAKEILAPFFPQTEDRLMNGMLCIVAKDGYRMAVSWSELFNRNDQQEMLIIEDTNGEDGGRFRFFPACDFFSDRAIKSVQGIYILE